VHLLASDELDRVVEAIARKEGNALFACFDLAQLLLEIALLVEELLVMLEQIILVSQFVDVFEPVVQGRQILVHIVLQHRGDAGLLLVAQA